MSHCDWGNRPSFENSHNRCSSLLAPCFLLDLNAGNFLKTPVGSGDQLSRHATTARVIAIGVVLVWAARMPAQPATCSNVSNGAIGASRRRPLPTPPPRPLPTRIVTNTNDSGPGSLRQALTDARNGDRIDFAASLNGQTITLTSAELLIDRNITVSGPGPDILAVSPLPNISCRIFHIMPGHSVTISGLTITGGYVGILGRGGGILNDHATLTISNCAVDGNGTAYWGGGLYNDGSNGSATLMIVDSTVSDNSCSGGIGGGIVNDGDEGSATMTLTKSTVSGNAALNSELPGDSAGGGIYNLGGVVVITKSTFSGNLASTSGGAIFNGGTITINDSTVSENTAGGIGPNFRTGSGGGITNFFATLVISNSTVSGNTAWGSEFKGPGFGGGVSSDHSLTINNSTFSSNSATFGGGISAGGGLIGNTILNNNSGANIDGNVTSYGYNISSDDGGGFLNGPGDQINTDPLLGPLQDNGGPTFTHALLPGSPAIDTGDPNFTPSPYYDQRGVRFIRVFNGRLDVGSFEVQPQSPFATPRPRPTPAPRPTP
jgi:hypothetical protein